MKCVMVMFDSLNRHMLPPYADTWVHAPNFRRLAERSTTFDTSYVCSMPCMPARRDLHTARPNFLHRSWGPLEPFDDSVPAMLSAAGVYTHLVTDHYHYWEDGGATYHGRYDTFELFRGQEGDQWIGQVAEPNIPPNLNGKGRRQDWVNREVMQQEHQYPQAQTFAAGLDFIRRNADQDKWFLQLEVFDPHEPFCSPRSYKDRYAKHYDAYDGPVFDWPGYRAVTETPEQVEHARYEYASLVSMCDKHLGDVLDAFDQHNLWQDTMLIVWTDHGFLLGEHNAWAKNWLPLYEEIAHTPFFLWDPRTPAAAGERRAALVQPSIDLGPTLLGYFKLAPTPDMLGLDLAGVVRDDTPVRNTALFGYHGGTINVTDGRYVYFRQPNAGSRAADYTLSPTVMRGFKPLSVFSDMETAGPFGFTKGCRLMQLGRPSAGSGAPASPHLLFDVHADPTQQHPLNDPAGEKTLADLMRSLMRACDAPPEQYARLGLALPD